MGSFVYMKILESSPGRYDKGIDLLSRGWAQKTKRRIVDEYVDEGASVMEIGSGTGTLAIMCARKGADVKGFDISEAMLNVAMEKIKKEGLENKIELKNMSITEMDKAYDDGEFDLVVSTLVISELSRQAREWAVKQAYRALKPGGWLALADEVKPDSLAKGLLQAAVRIPLAIITFILTQTSTHPVDGLEDIVKQAGFHIELVEREQMGSFMLLVARKGERN